MKCEEKKKVATELILLSKERLSELVASAPPNKRSALTKALQAAEKRATNKRDYEQAVMLATAVLENEWHLGKATAKFPTGWGNQHCHSNDKAKSRLLQEIGVTRQRANLAEAVAGSFTLPQLREWAKSLVGEITPGTPPSRYPRITAAATEAKRRARAAKNEAIESGVIEPPSGEYGVIVIDPPWPMQKVERDTVPHQSSELDYPTMEEEELASMTLPAAADCHLWLWTTHRFLPMAMRLIPRWDFKYVCVFVWHKPGGFQPVNLPQYNCEFAVYCRRGAPQFVDTKSFNTCFQAPRGKHSEKPELFYDMVRRVCGLSTRNRGLDMFNRRKIKSFDGWGNESI